MDVDVFKNVSIIIFVSRIYGLVPRSKGTVLRRLIVFIYSVTITGLYIIISIFFNITFLFIFGNVPANVKFIINVLYIQNTLKAILLFGILLINFIKSNDFILSLEKLNNLDFMFERKLRVKIPQIQRTVLQTVMSVSVILFGILFAILLHSTAKDWRIAIAWAVVNSINVLVLSNFTAVVHIFGLWFKEFNTFFTKMNSFSSINNSVSKKNFAFNIHHPFRRRNLNPLNTTRLRELHTIYHSLRDLLNEFNLLYAFQILLVICDAVIELIVMISITTFHLSFSDFMRKIFPCELYALHSLFKLSILFLLIYMAEETSKEANRTVMIVHDFLKEQTTEIRQGLELLRLDLWHNKIKINAYNVFDLNYQLILSIFSAATTYAIILIQFQLTSMETYKTGSSQNQ